MCLSSNGTYSLFFVLLVFLNFSCLTDDTSSYKISEDRIQQLEEKDRLTLVDSVSKLVDTVFRIQCKDSKIEVFYRTSQKHTSLGTILLLPGWNFPSDDWCTKMKFCNRATEAGYNLIMPQMGKSMYAMDYYKETRQDFLKYPTRRWMNDTMLPFFQEKFGMLLEGQNNYVCGISTGGRGAMLLALDHPKIFKKGISMSGDFDPLSMKNDHLLNLYYGSYEKFKARWENNDNAFLRLHELTIPYLILHGEADRVVPPSQSSRFYEEARKRNMINVKCKMVKNAGHNYKFWTSQEQEVLNFIETD